MQRYAQLNSSGVCFGISDLSASVDAPDMIAIGPDKDYLGWTYTDGTWVEPPPAPVVPVTFKIWKADIWRRCSNPEADILHDLLATQSARIQGIFNGASFISSGDDLFGTLQAGITQALGQTRADAILAPS